MEPETRRAVGGGAVIRLMDVLLPATAVLSLQFVQFSQWRGKGNFSIIWKIIKLTATTMRARGLSDCFVMRPYLMGVSLTSVPCAVWLGAEIRQDLPPGLVSSFVGYLVQGQFSRKT